MAEVETGAASATAPEITSTPGAPSIAERLEAFNVGLTALQDQHNLTLIAEPRYGLNANGEWSTFADMKVVDGRPAKLPDAVPSDTTAQ